MLSIIYINEDDRRREYCSFKALRDCGLDRFFDESVCKILIKDCSVSCIEKRNEFFSAMSDSGFLGHLETFEKKLSYSLEAFDSYSDSSCKAEEFFCFFQYLQAYSEMIEVAEAKYENDFWKNVSVWAKNEKNRLERVGEKIARYREIVESISSFCIKLYNGQLYISKKHPQKTLYDKLEDVFSDIGYRVKKQGALHIRLSKIFSDAFCQVFANETSELSALMGEIKACMDTEYFNLKEELDYYFSVYRFFSEIKKSGLPVCFASNAGTPSYRAKNMWDPLLFNRSENIVDNDVCLDGSESFFLLAGANGGGKTTYARSLISNLIFFKAGCPILASNAAIYPFRSIYTVFPSEAANEGSRFEIELKEINETIDNMPQYSFIVLNESFSTTNVDIAKATALNTVEKLNGKKAFGLFVTHFHELTEKVPTLSVVIDEAAENRRTFKVVKNKRSKSSFAEDILKKYKMDKMGLLERKAGYGLK